MKRTISVKLMLLLLSLMIGVNAAWAETVTYTVSSTSSVTASGTTPTDANAIYSSTYGTICQLTKGNSMTLSLKGFTGCKITGLTLSMKSNSSKGGGSLSMKAGTTTLAEIADCTFNNANWNGEYSTSYVNVTPTVTEYTVKDNEVVTITIAASTNSLYCQSFTIEYTPAGGESDTRTETELAWSAENCTATIGETNTFPTLSTTPSSLSGVTYSSSNIEAANIDQTTGEITLLSAGITKISASFAGDDTHKPATSVSYELTVKAAPVADEYVHDFITADDLAAKGTTYTDFSNVTKNTAKYAGNSSKNNGIQLRSEKSNSGIVSTYSGGNIKKVVVTWSSHCADGRKLWVYGSNTAYKNAADLYQTGTQGTRVGEIDNGKSTTLEVEGSYKYVGVRSSSGSLNIDEIEFVWDESAIEIKELSSISVNTDNLADYWLNDSFTPNGVVITATYSDNTTENVTVNCTFSGYDSSKTGNQTITVTYQDKTATYTINVKTIANTKETAYTAEEAKALVDAGKDLTTPVYVKGVVSGIATAFSETYGNISFYVSEDGTTTSQQFEFYRNYAGADNTKYASESECPQVGDNVIGYGTLTKYNETYEFAEGNYIVQLTRSTLKDATITATYSESLGINIDEEYTVTYNGDGELTIESSNEDVAEARIVDGNVMISTKAEGTTQITIKAPATSQYRAASLVYTLTVVDNSKKTATIDMTAISYQLANNQNVVWISDAAVIIADKAGATTNANNYIPTNKENPYKSSRFYTNSTLEIYPVSGATIKNITVTATSDGYASTLAKSTWVNATTNVAGKVVTITPKDGTKEMMATVANTAGVSSIVISYYGEPKAEGQVIILKNKAEQLAEKIVKNENSYTIKNVVDFIDLLLSKIQK